MPASSHRSGQRPSRLPNSRQRGHNYGKIKASGDSRLHLGDNHYHNVNTPLDSWLDTVASSLFFPELLTRHDNIEDNCTDTFSWALEQPSDRQPKWDSFLEWLSNDQSLYWIGGKPGSGKSTLMKYLVNRVNKDNEDNPQAPVILSFWFWEASNIELQRSINGCLRSLLWQLLQHPQHNKIVVGCIKKSTVLEWNNKKLIDTLKQAFEQLLDISVSLIIFLDGLDESGNDARDLLSLIKDLVKGYPKLKLCVSSRPEQLFQIHLSACPQLHMQDLNALDVEAIVRKQLFETPEFAMLDGIDVDVVQQIRVAVLNKAQGVLLWVCLVVRDLLRGIGNRDTIDELISRLERMPEELNDLYSLMLKRNHKDLNLYREHAALYCQLVSRTTRLTLIEFWLAINDEVREAYLRFDEGWKTLHTSFDPEKLMIWVNTRSGGLLETVPSLSYHSDRSWRRLFQPNDEQLTNVLAHSDFKVTFIHRTAKSYLIETREGKELLAACHETPTDIDRIIWEAHIVNSMVLSSMASPVAAGCEIIDSTRFIKLEFLPQSVKRIELTEYLCYRLFKVGLLWVEPYSFPTDLWLVDLISFTRNFPRIPFPGSTLDGIDFCQLWVMYGEFDAAQSRLQDWGKFTDAGYLTSLVLYAVYQEVQLTTTAKQYSDQIDDQIAFMRQMFKAGATPDWQVENGFGEKVSTPHLMPYLLCWRNTEALNMTQWLLQTQEDNISLAYSPSMKLCNDLLLASIETPTTYVIYNFTLAEMTRFCEEDIPPVLTACLKDQETCDAPHVVITRRSQSDTKPTIYVILDDGSCSLIRSKAEYRRRERSNGKRHHERAGVCQLVVDRQMTETLQTRGKRLSSMVEALQYLGKTKKSVMRFAAGEEARLRVDLNEANFQGWRESFYGLAIANTE